MGRSVRRQVDERGLRTILFVIAVVQTILSGCQDERLAPGAGPPVIARLNASPRLADFVVHAENSVRLQTGGVVVTGGDIGARGTGTGPFLSGNFAIDVLTGSTVHVGRSLIADSVRLGTGTKVGDIQTNRFTDSVGTTHGQVTALVPLPALPASAPVVSGTTNITVAAGATLTVSPGRFRTVIVNTGGRLQLTAGIYEVADVSISSGGRIEALGAVQVRVANRLTASAGAAVAAAAGMTLGARDIRIEVSGKNGATGALGATPPAASFASGGQITAIVLVPNGTLVLGTGIIANGAFLARDVDVGVGAKLTFKDGFPDSTCDPSSCDDGNPCNGVEVCQGDQCVPGTPVVCTAQDACHVAGVCDPEMGVCTNPIAEEGRPCDDGSGCTLNDACLAGSCFGGTIVVCAAPDQCRTAGACNPATGQCSSPPRPEGTGCNDGNACTGADACRAGACVGGETVICTASNPCREAGTCNPANGTCSQPFKPDGTACSDGSGCTVTDVCRGGVCTAGTPVMCPPADQCHQAGVCNEQSGTCTSVPKTDGTACNDSTGCTVGDACQGGACVGGQAVACAPADQCSEAGVCNPATGTCSRASKPDSAACNDGNACTQVDDCRAGVCVGRESMVCVAVDQCHTEGVCNPATGTCSTPARAENSPCNDNDPCTVGESCRSGVCSGANPVTCTAADACHETGICEPLTGVCSAPIKPSGSTCSDGNACTLTDTCQAGVCAGSEAVTCVAADSCHEAGTCNQATGVCSSPAKPNGATCNDGDGCTRTDTCEGGLCLGANPVLCVAAGVCRAPGTCEPSSGSCSNPPGPDGTPCDDSSACTQSDTCVGGACGGQPKTCPASTCRQTWSCEPSSGTCVASAPADAGSCASEEAMVIGQVLSDESGMPMDGATVRMSAESTATRAAGRYALPVHPGEVTLVVERDGFTSVDRAVTAVAGVGSVAVDARLTPLGAAVAVGEGPTTLTASLARWGAAPVIGTVTIPSGAVPVSTGVRLTALSAQGLPGLLPLGWSPLVAFDLRTSGDATAGGAIALAVAGLGGVAAPPCLVSYDRGIRAWRFETTLAAEGANISGTLPRLGSYAVVVPDAPGAPGVPASGEPLPGLPSAAISPALTAFGAGRPQALPATGGLVEGRIILPSATPLPSGTVLSAAVSESYNLTAGPVASAPTRLADVAVFRSPLPEISGVIIGETASALGGSFAITPARAYTAARLARGNVHVDILAGREHQRGRLGGLDSVTVTAGAATLSLAAGTLARQTVVDIAQVGTPDYVPRTADLVPLAQIEIDFVGATLATSAQLSVANLTVADGDTVLLARLERVDGVASPMLVSAGEPRETQWAFAASSGLPGITQEGEYVIYRSSAPLGFVAGNTTVGGAGVPALVTAEGLPFVALSGPSGAFQIPARPGVTTLRARLPNSNLAGSVTVEVTPGETTTATIALDGVATLAAALPASGAVGVPRSTQITLTTSAPVDPASATIENLRLFLGPPAGGQQVAVSIQLSASNTSIAMIPTAQLQPGTAYTFQASGLVDSHGAPVPALTTTFTTKVETSASYDTDKITFSIPDASGQVSIDVPAGTLPPGTTILLTNEGNGIVISFTVGNGGLHDTLPASIDDKLVISVTDPLGRTATFTRSQFVGANGATAIGPGGGVVKGPGGIELRVPEGAVKYGTVFTLKAQDLASLPDRPPLAGGSFSAVRVEVKGNPFFSKEIDLVFPKPTDAPDGAFYYVFKRHIGAPSENLAGGAAYEVIDHAFVEGTGPNARVVTASCPFPGFQTAYAGWMKGLAGIASAASILGSVPTAAEGVTAVLEDLSPDAFGQLVDTAVDKGVAPAWLGMLTDPGGTLVWGSTMVLGYTYSEIRKNLPTVGLIHGRAVRVVPGSNPPRFEPVQGAVVTGKDASGHPLTDNAASDHPQPFAYTQADGTYVLWDMFPSAGNLSLIAVAQSAAGSTTPQVCPPKSLAVQCETAFQHVIEKCGTQTTFYANQASANFTFPAPPIAAGPIPPVTIRVMRNKDGQRSATGGVAIEGEPLLIGFVGPDASVQSFEISHNGIREPGTPVRRDPLANQPLAVDQIADFTPTAAGTYTITATALPLPSGPAFTVASTFRVVAAGGDTTSPVPDSPPGVVTDRTIPSNGSDGVPTSVAIQIVFTEPVLGVADQVRFHEAASPHSPVSVTLTGITRNGNPVDLDPSNPGSVAITSLTIQPRRQLRYGTKYELTLGSGIFDLDNTLPGGPGAGRTMDATTTTFMTVVPEALTEPGSGFGSPGVTTVGDYAYLFESAFTYGLLHVFDVSSPAEPVEFPDAQQRALGRPMGIAAEGDPTGAEATVVVATGPASTSLPSNIRIYRARQSSIGVTTEWVGAATLSATAAEGIVQRVAIKGAFAYAVSTQKGLQVVDIEVAKMVFANLGGDVSAVRVPLNTDGMGVGQEAVVSTISILKGNRPAFLYDVKVAELNDGFLQPIAVIAGDVGIVLVNPQTAEVLPVRPLEARGYRARAVDVGRVHGRDIAAVVGEQNNQSSLVLVDITEPRSPVIKGELLLLQRPLDVKIAHDLALIGTDTTIPRVEIVNIEDIAAPIDAGHIDNVAGHVAVARNGALVTNMPAKADELLPFLGRIRTATLGLLPVIARPLPVLVRDTASGNLETMDDVPMRVDVYSASSNLQTSTIVLEAHSAITELERIVTPLVTDPIVLRSSGTTLLPSGHTLPNGHRYFVRPTVTVNGTVISGEAVEVVTLKYPCRDDDVRSGRDWLTIFPPTAGLDCMEPTARASIESFVTAVRNNGQECPNAPPDAGSPTYANRQLIEDGNAAYASVVRSLQRQYLMYYAVAIDHTYPQQVDKLDPLDIPPYSTFRDDCWQTDVKICWVHTKGTFPRHLQYDREESLRAAKEMVAAFGFGGAPGKPSANSRHAKGLAADIRLRWTAPWSVCRKDGVSIDIPYSPDLLSWLRGLPDNGLNTDLQSVAKTYGLDHLSNEEWPDPNHWDVPVVPWCPHRDGEPSCRRLVPPDNMLTP